jgi:hypothetical protein
MELSAAIRSREFFARFDYYNLQKWALWLSFKMRLLLFCGIKNSKQITFCFSMRKNNLFKTNKMEITFLFNMIY